jgi:hypothetical protein
VSALLRRLCTQRARPGTDSAATARRHRRDSRRRSAAPTAHSPPTLRGPCSVLYFAVVATNLLQCGVGIAAYDSIYPASPTAMLLGPPSLASRARAVLLLVMGNGVMWLVYYAKFSPLPFRWVLLPEFRIGLSFCGSIGASGRVAPCHHSIHPPSPPHLTQQPPPANPALRPTPAGGSGPSWALPPAC